MKKSLILIVASLAMFSSCSIHKAAITSEPVDVKVQAATAASLTIAPSKVSFTYYPETFYDKRVSENTAVKNAIFKAASEHNFDVMVGVNYLVTKRRGLFGSKIMKVTISGFPATYKDFRDPTPEDRANVEAFNASTVIVKE